MKIINEKYKGLVKESLHLYKRKYRHTIQDKIKKKEPVSLFFKLGLIKKYIFEFYLEYIRYRRVERLSKILPTGKSYIKLTKYKNRYLNSLYSAYCNFLRYRKVNKYAKIYSKNAERARKEQEKLKKEKGKIW
mgnify:CR=1 FL=1